ncbi:hypothetical protein D3C86_1533100 [compost metagenome]
MINGTAGSSADPAKLHAGATLLLCRSGDRATNNYATAFERKHNGGGGVPGRGNVEPSVASLYDGAPHDVILEWTNYFAYDPIAGTVRRFMWQRLYIDGVKVAEQDVAVLYGATRWAEIDPSRLISDGNCFSVISTPLDAPAGGYAAPGGVIVEFPTLPNGAIPDAA